MKKWFAKKLMKLAEWLYPFVNDPSTASESYWIEEEGRWGFPGGVTQK